MTNWQRYVRDMGNRMGLKDWVLTVLDQRASDGSDAQIKCIYGNQRADIMLGDDFDDTTPEDQRAIICHELLHAHLARLNDAIRHVEPLVGTVAWSVLEGQLDDSNELAVEGLAQVLAPFLPLPPTKRPAADAQTEQVAA